MCVGVGPHQELLGKWAYMWREPRWKHWGGVQNIMLQGKRAQHTCLDISLRAREGCPLVWEFDQLGSLSASHEVACLLVAGLVLKSSRSEGRCGETGVRACMAQHASCICSWIEEGPQVTLSQPGGSQDEASDPIQPGGSQDEASNQVQCADTQQGMTQIGTATVRSSTNERHILRGDCIAVTTYAR